MVRNPFLGDMLTTLFERRKNPLFRSGQRSIDALSEALLTEQGEISGIALAKEILSTYAASSQEEKLAFFYFLNDALELNAEELSSKAAAYAANGDVSDYRDMVRATEPRRQELLRRLNQPTGATAELVAMRVDLLGFLKDHPDLKRTEIDFVHLLRSWFNRGFLVLRQISWETPASILEKIVAYEAVHAINDWDDLRRRLHPPDRRCFAYFHPAMPEEPLIFVEVALTRSIPNSIQHVLSETRELRDVNETSVAVFYSISNCQQGLAGISFGNLLIKQVVDELSAELPNLKTFVTLSPIPKLNAWLEAVDLGPSNTMPGVTTPDEITERLASHYLMHAKDKLGRPYDPVARFHLGNGALIHAVHANADLTEKGQAQSGGAMVNYLYDLGLIEKNHESFVSGGTIPASKTVRTRADIGTLDPRKAPAS